MKPAHGALFAETRPATIGQQIDTKRRRTVPEQGHSVKNVIKRVTTCKLQTAPGCLIIR